ncbi:MAG TPA: MarR family transcriptional regulator [Polyangiales bacterium]
MSRPTLSPSDYRALAEFRYLIRSFLSFSERAARSFGSEPQQHQLLLACKGLPLGKRPTIGTLAQRLCVEHHTAVALVDKLEAAGLVKRTPSPTDRREVLVEITDSGEKLLSALSELHHQQLQTVGPKLIEALSGVLDAHQSAHGSK